MGDGSKYFLSPPYALTNFEIQKCYQNELRFNRVLSRANLPNKAKDGTYVINLDKYADIGTHWIALLCTKIGRNLLWQLSDWTCP